MKVPFATNSYVHDSLPISAQRVVNLYAEAQPEGAKTSVAVLGAPGITEFASAGEGPIRGRHMMGGLLYVVSGARLYSITNDPTPVVTLLGTGVSGSGIVRMADNDDQLMIVNGTNGYVYSASSGFQLVTDVDFHAANTVAFLNQFFLFDWAGTNKFFRSDLLDGTSYDSTAFASAEASSDRVIAVENLKEVLYVMGQDTIEPWANNSAANFPFQRIPGGTMSTGVLSAYGHAQEDESLFMLGSDRMAYRLSGTSLQRISQHAIEGEWQSYPVVSDAFAMSCTFKGHKIVYFTFPTQSKTWAYDISTGYWHERESRDLNGTPLGRWRANCLIEAYGKVLVGDAYSGKIGYLDDTVNTEFGDPMYALAVGATLHGDGNPIFISEFRLDIETGVGLSSGQGSDPQIMLDVSEDHGHTWSDLQDWNTMGSIGNYLTQVFWKRMGRYYQFTPRITISDPVRRKILGATARLTTGAGSA